MQPDVSLEIILKLLDEKQFARVADLILKSLHARRSTVDVDSSSEFVVSQILMTVVRHLRFIEAFGEAGEPHEDANGTYCNRYDDYFNVWRGLGAFGIDSEVFARSMAADLNNDERSIN